VITREAFQRFGIDENALRLRFDQDRDKMTEGDRALVNRWASRAEQGRQFNLQHYRLYLAIDRSWQKSFSAAPQELIGMLKEMSSAASEDDAVDIVSKWKLTHMLVPRMDPKTGETVGGKQSVSWPAIHEVVLSVARSYTMMRHSRVVNERMNVPFFKYEPAYQSDDNRLKCEVITQDIDRKSRDFGYPSTFKMAHQGAVKYGQQLQFVKEEWYREIDYDLDEQRIGKEGLRYVTPHPNKTFYSLDDPIWTLNTDTGTRFCGYWRTTTYGQIRLNNKLWNRDRIRMSHKMGSPEWMLYFQTTGQCRMAGLPGNSSQMVTNLDREVGIENSYYSRAQDEFPIWVTELFEKVNLKNDLGEHLPDVDVWFRIVLASDDTPIYACALPGPPAVVWLYEPDDQMAVQEGLMLQVMPFETHVANMLTQGCQTLNDNLMAGTLYNSDLLNPATVRAQFANPNGAKLRKHALIPFSFTNARRTQIQGPNDVVWPIAFQAKNIQEHLAMIGQLLAMLERVVGMSAQEVGSTASHEQTAEEQKMIHQSTAQRADYIAGWADFAIESWKSQLYRYTMSFGSMMAIANIAPELEARARAINFQIGNDGPNRPIAVRGPFQSLRVESFAAQRDGPNRVPWVTLGNNMIQFMQGVLGNQALMQSGVITPPDMVKLLNQGLEAIGLPRSFRLRMPEMQTPTTQQAMMGALAEFSEQIKQYISAEQQDQMEAIMKQVEKYVDAKQADTVIAIAAEAKRQAA